MCTMIVPGEGFCSLQVVSRRGGMILDETDTSIAFYSWGDDLWPHLQEGSEKPITKNFQFSHFDLIVLERRDQQEGSNSKIENYGFWLL